MQIFTVTKALQIVTKRDRWKFLLEIWVGSKERNYRIV